MWTVPSIWRRSSVRRSVSERNNAEPKIEDAPGDEPRTGTKTSDLGNGGTSVKTEIDRSDLGSETTETHAIVKADANSRASTIGHAPNATIPISLVANHATDVMLHARLEEDSVPINDSPAKTEGSETTEGANETTAGEGHNNMAITIGHALHATIPTFRSGPHATDAKRPNQKAGAEAGNVAKTARVMHRDDREGVLPTATAAAGRATTTDAMVAGPGTEGNIVGARTTEESSAMKGARKATVVHPTATVDGPIRTRFDEPKGSGRAMPTINPHETSENLVVLSGATIRR